MANELTSASKGKKSRYQKKWTRKLRCKGKPEPQWMWWFESAKTNAESKPA